MLADHDDHHNCDDDHPADPHQGGSPLAQLHRPLNLKHRPSLCRRWQAGSSFHRHQTIITQSPQSSP